MKISPRVRIRVPALASMLVLTLAAGVAHAGGSHIYWGAPVAVGHGHARVIVAEGADGAPTSVQVLLDERALEGLPQATATQKSWEYVLSMPAHGPKTGYDHVGLDWNPVGHRPVGIYTVPHFDVHFYLVTRAQQQAVSFEGPNRARAIATPDPSLLPTGYVAPPDTAEDRMGLHGIDTASPEFHGKPFTYTFLYGYYEGRTTFVEPMITLAFLQRHPDVIVPVKRPAAYSVSAYYPDRYRVAYVAQHHQYVVALLGLRSYRASVASAQ